MLMYIGVCTAITTSGGLSGGVRDGLSGGVCGLRDNIGADGCIRGHCSVAIVTSKRRVPVRRTVKILEQKKTGRTTKFVTNCISAFSKGFEEF